MSSSMAYDQHSPIEVYILLNALMVVARELGLIGKTPSAAHAARMIQMAALTGIALADLSQAPHLARLRSVHS